MSIKTNVKLLKDYVIFGPKPIARIFLVLSVDTQPGQITGQYMES